MDLASALNQTLNAHTLGVVGLAFLGGLVSSFLPCTIGMLPVLVGYIGGYSRGDKAEVVQQAFLFVTGLALVMTVLGVLAGLVGVTFGSWMGSWAYYGMGGLAVLMGLQLLGVIHLPLPQVIKRMPEASQTRLGRLWTPLLLGMAFGATSSPCGTPFLTTILGFISREKNILLGGSSLFFYALGQGMLLFVVGLFTGMLKHLALIRHVGFILNQLSGIVFILVGCMFIAEGLGLLTGILAILHLQ